MLILPQDIHESQIPSNTNFPTCLKRPYTQYSTICILMSMSSRWEKNGMFQKTLYTYKYSLHINGQIKYLHCHSYEICPLQVIGSFWQTSFYDQ